MINQNNDLPKILLITFPLGKTGVIPFSNLLILLKDLSNGLLVITGGEGYKLIENDETILKFRINSINSPNLLIRILRYIKIQLEIAFLILKIRSEFDLVVFFIGGESFVIPSICTKLIKKDLILILAGFPSKIAELNKDPLFKFNHLLSKIVLKFSNKIVVYSKNVINERSLQKYDEKLYIAHRHFVDLNVFKLMNPLSNRENIVGYVGTLNQLKGVNNLKVAIKELIEKNSNIKFIIVGDGPLMDEFKDYVIKNGLGDKILLKGWVPHEQLPFYLNQFKLIVLPSLTEGLPNVLIEAMVCGTPVLTTAVGAIPDIITDHENGFLLKDNKPRTIARSIEECLEYDELNRIAENGLKYAAKNYNLREISKNWQKIINK